MNGPMEVIVEFASTGNPEQELLDEVAGATKHGELITSEMDWDNLSGGRSRAVLHSVMIDGVEDLMSICRETQVPVIVSIGGLAQDLPLGFPVLTIYDSTIE